MSTSSSARVKVSSPRKYNYFPSKVPLRVSRRQKNGRRVCYHCAKSKLLKEFGSNGMGGKRGICFECTRIQRRAHVKAKRLMPGDPKKIPTHKICKRCNKDLNIEYFTKRSELDKKYSEICIWCGQRKWSLDCYHRHQAKYNEMRQLCRLRNPENTRLARLRYSEKMRAFNSITRERSLRSLATRSRLMGRTVEYGNGVTKRFNKGNTESVGHISSQPTASGIRSRRRG